MNKITKPAPHTPLPAIQPAARLPEVRHGAQFTVDGPRGVPAAVERVARRLRAVLVLEPRVHVPDQVVVVVVAHDELLHLAVLAHLAPDVLVEGVEVVLQLGRGEAGFGVVGWVLVEVGQEDGLGVGGFDVFAGAAVAVPAGADFVVEAAVDFVLFRAEDGGEVVGHDGGQWRGRSDVCAGELGSLEQSVVQKVLRPSEGVRSFGANCLNMKVNVRMRDKMGRLGINLEALCQLRGPCN